MVFRALKSRHVISFFGQRSTSLVCLCRCHAWIAIGSETDRTWRRALAHRMSRFGSRGSGSCKQTNLSKGTPLLSHSEWIRKSLLQFFSRLLSEIKHANCLLRSFREFSFFSHLWQERSITLDLTKFIHRWVKGSCAPLHFDVYPSL